MRPGSPAGRAARPGGTTGCARSGRRRRAPVRGARGVVARCRVASARLHRTTCRRARAPARCESRGCPARRPRCSPATAQAAATGCSTAPAKRAPARASAQRSSCRRGWRADMDATRRLGGADEPRSTSRPAGVPPRDRLRVPQRARRRRTAGGSDRASSMRRAAMTQRTRARPRARGPPGSGKPRREARRPESAGGRADAAHGHAAVAAGPRAARAGRASRERVSVGGHHRVRRRIERELALRLLPCRCAEPRAQRRLREQTIECCAQRRNVARRHA